MPRRAKELDVVRHPKKRAFLTAYANCGNVTVAAETVGVNRQTHYQWLKSDALYAEWFEDAEEEATERLEAVARERAVEGSDNLLMFLLKSRRPEKYRERYDINAQVVTIDAIDAEIARIESQLAAGAPRSVGRGTSSAP